MATDKIRYLTFRLNRVGVRQSSIPELSGEGDLFEIEVGGSIQDNKDAFKASEAGGKGIFKIYTDPTKYPSSGDCFVQIWELDKFSAFQKEDWKKQQNQYKYFAYWYTQQETDKTEKTDKNELLGNLRGYITLANAGTKQKPQLRYKFICTDDSQIPKASAEQPFIMLQYQKHGEKEVQRRKLPLGGEYESIYELGAYPTQEANDTKWENSMFTYPVVFVESMRNIVRNQIEEGGLTVACHAELNSGDDDLSLEFYKFYVKELEAQLTVGLNDCRSALRSARTELKPGYLKAANSQSDDSVWNLVEEEVEWQGNLIRYLIHAGSSHKPSKKEVKIKFDLKPEESKLLSTLSKIGDAVDLGKLQTLRNLVASELRFAPEEFKVEFSKKNAWKISDKHKNLFGTLTPFTVIIRGIPYAKVNQFVLARTVNDIQEYNWRKAYQAHLNSKGKAKALPMPVLEYPRLPKIGFISWSAGVDSGFKDMKKESSPTNVINFMKKKYLNEKYSAGNKFGGKENLAISLDRAAVVVPKKFQDFSPTGKGLYDVSNDREFPNNSAELAKEFAFIGLGKKQIIAKTDAPLSSKATQTEAEYITKTILTKSSRGVTHLNKIIPYLNEVRSVVRTTYPDLCKKLLGDKDIKIYRLIIFTHGGGTYGLKFPDTLYKKKIKGKDGKITEKDMHWFDLELLSKDEGKKFVSDLASIMAPTAVVALYACSTGGTRMDQLKKMTEELILEIKENQKEKLSKIDKELNEEFQNLCLDWEKKQGRKPNKSEKGAIFREFSKSGAYVQKNKEMKDIKSQANAEIAQLKTPYKKLLLAYGGKDALSSKVSNVRGRGSFADTLSRRISEKGIKVSVWSHTDAGHTSRNARMRLFFAQGKDSTPYDLVRLVFEGTQEFNKNGEPSKEQLLWWWNRGEINAVPKEHAHSIKKAALCAYDSLNDSGRPYSLKKIIDDFRNWYNSK